VSAATVWEISIKHGLGRIDVPMDQLPADIEASRFLALHITPAHAIAAGKLPHHHRDPFDRMLIGQAQIEGLTLVTHDKLLQRYGIPVLLS
jgi:PIN domain nuclease of toxin-antitoxin system